MNPAVNQSARTGGKDTWRTPESVLAPVREFFGGKIDLDPCADRDPGNWFAEENTTEDMPLSIMNWWGKSVFVNPPYSNVMAWVRRCFTVTDHRIALVPARVDTNWFEQCWMAAAVCFWKGRIKFVGAENSAPFPSALIYWGPNRYRFADIFEHYGKVVLL